MDDILVSISCITFNHEKYIVDAIEGFLMQRTDFKFEILIHDDASTDKTADIIREYENKYPDLIKPVYQLENQYSKGIKVDHEFNHKRAKGKYIAECEGDDYWLDPYKLQKQVDYLEGHPECSLCFHPVIRVKVDKTPFGDFIGYFGKQYKILTISDIGGAFLGTASKMYVKSTMDNPPEFYFTGEAGDFPSQLIISDKGDVGYLPEAMAAYRVNVPGSSNNRFNSKSNEEIIKYNGERIEILNEFDKYSGFRHEKDVKKFAIKYELNILLLEKKITNRLNGLKYLKGKGYFSSIGFEWKIKTYAICLFPLFYKEMQCIKERIKELFLNTNKIRK